MSLVLVEAERTESKHDPGGELWERLDTSRREIVELCGEKGVMLFKFLLVSSTRLPGQEDMAACPLQRLHDVAEQLQASPDTVKRYVAVFRALSLVHHYHDQRREVKLHIPLGPYRPLTNFTTLDELIGMRKKQRQLAQKVKMRYITRLGDPTQAYSDEVRTKFQELSTILEGEHLEPLKRQRLQMKIADLLTQLMTASGSSMGDLNATLGHLKTASSGGGSPTLAEEGDSNEGKGVLCSAKKPVLEKDPAHMRDLNHPEGDLISPKTLSSQHQTQQMGDSSPQQGDLTVNASSEVAHQSERQGDPKVVMGDSTPQTLVQPDQVSGPQDTRLGDSNLQQGDLIAVQSMRLLQKNDQLGDPNAQTTLKAGDSNQEAGGEVCASVPATYNVNYLISNITSNNVIRNKKNDEIARFLASVLEKHDYENGKPTFSKFLKAFTAYTPQVIGRAFLVTMVLLHQKHWKVNSRGALFTNQCKILSGDPKYPFVHYTLTEIEEWMQAWGNLPYAELITVLATPEPEPAPPEPAPLVTPTNSRTVAPSPAANKRLTGYSSASPGGKPKRTYGMHYTGLPSGRYNTAGTSRPPQDNKS
jgi:hypothetical protein